MLKKLLNRDNIEKITKLIDDGYLSCSVLGNLRVLKYTPETVFSKNWNKYTLQCRGLVVNSDWEIVARPFDKFFNYDEPEADFNFDDLKDVVSISEKMDGSLGVVFYYNDKWNVNTPGSFVSEQAVWAQNWIDSNLELFSNLDKSYTYMFEIIYPENRIVVDYKGLNSLILLGARHTENGKYLNLSLIEYPYKVKIYSKEEFNSMWENKELDNFEGFVISYFKNGKFKQVKFKFKNYFLLHKLLTSFTIGNIYEVVKTGNINEYLEIVPDEFFSIIEKEIKDAESVYNNLKYDLNNLWIELSKEIHFSNYEISSEYYKNMALLIKKSIRQDRQSYFFNRMRNLDTEKTIWNIIENSLVDKHKNILR